MKCLTNIYLLVFLVGFTCQHRAAAEEGKTAATGLFDAIDGGRVDVQIIALSAKQANVLITNQSDKPLHLELPKTIPADSPVPDRCACQRRRQCHPSE